VNLVSLLEVAISAVTVLLQNTSIDKNELKLGKANY